MDVLGGFDKELKGKLAVLIGKAEAKRVLLAMLKTVRLHAIRIMNNCITLLNVVSCTYRTFTFFYMLKLIFLF